MKFIPNNNSSILDIGSAMGGLLNRFKKNGYSNLYALEPSQNCVNYMKNEYGINAFQGDVFDNFDILFKNKKFDFIILSHVLEHIYDLKKAISNIKSILNDKGKIYIEVPDSSRYYNYYIVPYYYFDIEHINHFNDFSLSTLFATFGFKSIQIKEKSISVSKNIKYPAVFGVFELNNKSMNSTIKYIDLSKQNDQNKILNELVNSQEECIIWGAGNFTKRLLAQTDLRKCNILYFIDKDTNKQEHNIVGIKIKSPKILKEFNVTIIVASALFSSEIIDEIKNLNCKNKIVVLK